jgi:uncharacterized coiled-coil protein SlyX
MAYSHSDLINIIKELSPFQEVCWLAGADGDLVHQVVEVKRRYGMGEADIYELLDQVTEARMCLAGTNESLRLLIQTIQSDVEEITSPYNRSTC